MTSFREDGWFAGFTDGEACFLIAPRNTTRLAPTFAISLRVDDLPILETLRAEFGGTVCFKTPRGRDHASATWSVTKKANLAGLVDYFDRFPLRAKKARDYAIWRRAVVIYRAHGSYAPELWPLREALIAGRKFGAIETALKESPQLRLVS